MSNSKIEVKMNKEQTLITELLFLVAKYPNDMDLGKSVRKIINTYINK